MHEWVLGQNIVRAIRENFNSQRKCNEDFQIGNPMHSTVSKTNKENIRLNIKWKAPPIGWIKGNFDGVAKGNLGRVGCGGVLRNHSSNIIDAITIAIGISTSHKAEATTTLYTMWMAVETGYHYLWLEAD